MIHAKRFDIKMMLKRALSLALCLAMLAGMVVYVAEEVSALTAQSHTTIYPRCSANPDTYSANNNYTGSTYVYYAGYDDLYNSLRNYKSSDTNQWDGIDHGYEEYFASDENDNALRLNIDDTDTDHYMYFGTGNYEPAANSGYKYVLILCSSNADSYSNNIIPKRTRDDSRWTEYGTMNSNDGNGMRVYGDKCLYYLLYDISNHMSSNKLGAFRFDPLNATTTSDCWIDIYGFAILKNTSCVDEVIELMIEKEYPTLYKYDVLFDTDGAEYRVNWGPLDGYSSEWMYGTDHTPEGATSHTNSWQYNQYGLKVAHPMAFPAYSNRIIMQKIFITTLEFYNKPSDDVKLTGFSRASNLSGSESLTLNYGGIFEGENTTDWNHVTVAMQMQALYPNETNTFKLVANWEKTVTYYTATFKDHDGTVLGTDTVASGGTPTPPADPTRAQDNYYTYKFSHWEPAVGAITSDTTYTAQYTQSDRYYTITWNIDGATSTNNYKYNETPSKTAPTKTGYTFDGWSPAIAAVTKDQTYTATWKAKDYTYTVNYVSTTGASLGSSTVRGTFGTSKDVYPIDITGYTTPGKQYITWDAESKTITFTYTPNNYTYNIVYQSNTGAQLGIDTVTKAFGTTHTISPKAFTGYNPPASQDITWDKTSNTITFTYTPKTYTITFDYNDGTGRTHTTPTTDPAVTYGSGNYSEVKWLDPTRDGYDFLGWYTAGEQVYDKNGFCVAGTYWNSSRQWHYDGNLTVYAQWAQNDYTITYNGNGATSGSVPDNQSAKFDAEVTLPGNTGGLKREYTVTYNGGSGTPDRQSDLAAYTFMGWEDYGTITYNGQTFTGDQFDAPFYANNWNDLYNAFGYNKYALIGHYYDNVLNGNKENRWPVAKDGVRSYYSHTKVVKNLTTVQGGTVELRAHWNSTSVTLPNATRAGYEFAGWYVGDTRVGGAGELYTPEANVTLEARWTLITYTLTFHENGGTYATQVPANYTVETETFSLPTISRAGHTFLGWYGSEDFTGDAVTTIAQGSTGNKTFWAKWVAAYGTITLARPAGIDADQDFIFTIKGKEDNSNIEITVVSHEDEVVINNVPVGDYTVAEWDNWSWRYESVTVTTSGDAPQTVTEFTVDSDGEELTYTVNNRVTQWLSGDSYSSYRDEEEAVS